MSEHAWFEQHLAGYHTGGLTAEERERFERHAAGCKDCARSLNDWAGFDHSMDGLFAEVRPEAGLENRLLQGLRTATSRPRRRLPVFRIAAGIAALVMLGVVGAVMQNLLENGNLPLPGLWGQGPGKRIQAGNNLKQIVVVDDSRSTNDIFKRLPPGIGAKNRIDPNDIYSLAFTPDGHHIAMGDGSVRNVNLWKDGTSNTFEVFEPSRIHTSMEEDLIGGKQKRREPALQEGKEWGRKGLAAEGRELGFQVVNERLKTVYNEFGFGAGISVPDDGFATLGGMAVGGKAGGGSGPGKTGTSETPPVNMPPPDKKAGGAAYFSPAEPVADKTPQKARPVATPPKYTVTSGKPRKVEEEVVAGEKSQPPAPPAGGRKIVRTGDIEYEVDSFDAAVERINKLIEQIKGAFVATTNSDKLANGKMKGSVVVRMPPDNLDKFLADLRKDLGKTGELKSLRIGSSDITKQYTDVESRLRAAKTMETRLLQIIKTGKGEIKDLIAAEHELGLWRTKIEEMEGEIRYYNNQVSLSKLTIGLTEKEIRAASGLEIAEKIKMRIEAEEVEKAQETVLDEVKKAKGRIIKSDLKLHGAGQLEAIMIFEVAPEKVSEMRKVLRQIGNITKDEAERQQTAVGGTEPAGNIKPQVKNTNFEVRLYNLANIQPRETLTLTVATLDVPGSYKKLQEAVKGKGQVRRGQFNEQDKLNINAVVDFDLNVKDRPGIDKVLAEVGKEIGRSTDQAQPSDNVTDQKVGYRLTLRSVTSIPPREKITLAIEVKNVEQTTNELVDSVKSHKGLVATGPLYSLDSNGQVRGVILFDVPFAVKDDLVKQFKTVGTVRVQQTSPNPKVPENELATAHIDVALSSVGPIISGEDALGPQIRKSLFYCFKIFSFSLMFVILGILGILPPVLVVLVAIKLVRKWRKTKTAT
jgi:hypothetical protein